MSADLMYLSADHEHIVLIENKIGSAFTSGGSNPETGQLGRQAKYLIRSSIVKKYLIVLSSKSFFGAKWYSSEMIDTLNKVDMKSSIEGYLIYWEEVFSAL